MSESINASSISLFKMEQLGFPDKSQNVGSKICQGIIKADFDGSEYGSEYLRLSKGAIVELQRYDDLEPNWAFGRRADGQKGWFPTTYWEPCGSSSCTGSNLQRVLNQDTEQLHEDRTIHAQNSGSAIEGSLASALPCGKVSLDTRSYNLGCVVVNFVNVGMTYGREVKKRTSSIFSWCGVRKCVHHLVNERNFRVIGVIWYQFSAESVQGVPDDIVKMCECVQYTPRFTDEIYGERFRGADDEMTIKLAYRRNCWFLDNDNYKDWRKHIFDPNVARWLERNHKHLSMKYFFDSQTGVFDTLDGISTSFWR